MSYGSHCLQPRFFGNEFMDGSGVPQASPRSSTLRWIKGSKIHGKFLCDEAVEYLRHPRPADPKKTGERRPAFKLTGVEKRLIITGETKGIAGRFLR
jgi:hypothetical protein